MRPEPLIPGVLLRGVRVGVVSFLVSKHSVGHELVRVADVGAKDHADEAARVGPAIAQPQVELVDDSLPLAGSGFHLEVSHVWRHRDSLSIYMRWARLASRAIGSLCSPCPTRVPRE